MVIIIKDLRGILYVVYYVDKILTLKSGEDYKICNIRKKICIFAGIANVP